jgi:hypothetical protein
MSSSSWEPGSREPSKPYRRRKKHQGADWSGEGNALKEDGVWCKFHKQRHGYKSKMLGFKPERYNGKSYIHWYCKETGDVLDTIVVGGGDSGARVHGSDGESRSGGSHGSGTAVPGEVQG